MFMAILILLRYIKYVNYIFQFPYKAKIIKDNKNTTFFVKIHINFYVDVHAALYIYVSNPLEFQHNSLQNLDFS